MSESGDWMKMALLSTLLLWKEVIGSCLLMFICGCHSVVISEEKLAFGGLVYLSWAVLKA